MDSRLKRDLLLRLNLALALISGLLTLWYMTREPSEAQAAMVGGFSLPRVLIIFVIILFLSIIAWLFISSLRRNFWSGRSADFVSRIFLSRSLPIILLSAIGSLLFHPILFPAGIGELFVVSRAIIPSARMACIPYITGVRYFTDCALVRSVSSQTFSGPVSGSACSFWDIGSLCPVHQLEPRWPDARHSLLDGTRNAAFDPTGFGCSGHWNDFLCFSKTGRFNFQADAIIFAEIHWQQFIPLSVNLGSGQRCMAIATSQASL